MNTPAIPTLEEVKTILGDRVTEWTEEQITGALAYVDVLAERIPPVPKIYRHDRLEYAGHVSTCVWYKATDESLDSSRKGVLCTCDPERPR